MCTLAPFTNQGLLLSGGGQRLAGAFSQIRCLSSIELRLLIYLYLETFPCMAGSSTPNGKEERLALSIKNPFDAWEYRLVSGSPAYYLISWSQTKLVCIWLSLTKMERTAFKAVVFPVSDFPYATATGLLPTIQLRQHCVVKRCDTTC